MKSTVDSYENKHYIYVYIYICFVVLYVYIVSLVLSTMVTGIRNILVTLLRCRFLDTEIDSIGCINLL